MAHKNEPYVFAVGAVRVGLFEIVAEGRAPCIHKLEYDETVTADLFEGGFCKTLYASDFLGAFYFVADIINKKVWRFGFYRHVYFWNSDNSLRVIFSNNGAKSDSFGRG